MNGLDPLPHNGSNIAPDGRPFPWGPVVAVHRIGEFEIVEYLRDNSNTSGSDKERLVAEHGAHFFAIYANGVSLGRSADSLDNALIVAIALKYDGFNTRADGYFRRMLGFEIDPDYASRIARGDKAKAA